MSTHPLVANLALRIASTLILAPAVANAQAVLSPPTNLEPANVTGQPAPAQTKAPSASKIGSLLRKTGPLAKWGPINVRPHLSYNLSYGDGLLNPEQQESNESYIHAVGIGSLFEVGQHWTVDYTALKNFYSNLYIRDTLDHNLNIAGHLSRDEWTFSLSLVYGSNTPLLVETGRQTKQEFYTISVSTSYQLGDRTLLDASVVRTARLANADIENPRWTDADWYSWILSGRANYQISPRLTLGAGVELTFDDVSRGANMSSTQPHLLITWRPTNKISLTARGGAESRRIDDTNADTLENPIYSASLGYEPLPTTTIGISATQAVTASYFANQASRNTTIGVNLSQRILQRYFLSAGASRGTTDYIATARGFLAGRTDRFTSYNARVSTVFLGRGSIGIFFQTGRNHTNEREFDFSSRQYGMETSYRF